MVRGSEVLSEARHDDAHAVGDGGFASSQHGLGPDLLHSDLLTQFRNFGRTFLMKLETTSSTTESIDQQTSATLAESETKEGLPDKVMTNPGGDGEVIRHLHLDLLPLQHGDVRVPVDGGPGGVVGPVHGARLWGQLPQLHRLTKSIPQGDSMLDRNTRPSMISKLCS